MSTYLERYEVIGNTGFKARMQMALWIAAIAVLASGSSTAGAKTWARNSLKTEADTDTAKRMAIRCASTGLGLSSTDAEIQTAVDTVVAEMVA
jgi:hypothetical protein